MAVSTVHPGWAWHLDRGFVTFQEALMPTVFLAQVLHLHMGKLRPRTQPTHGRLKAGLGLGRDGPCALA